MGKGLLTLSSHHPPVTAYSIFNETHKVRLEGYNGQRASFSGRTITVRQIGHAKLHLGGFDEDYLITLPSLHIEGLVYGTPYVGLVSSPCLALRCDTNYSPRSSLTSLLSFNPLLAMSPKSTTVERVGYLAKRTVSPPRSSRTPTLPRYFTPLRVNGLWTLQSVMPSPRRTSRHTMHKQAKLPH